MIRKLSLVLLILHVATGCRSAATESVTEGSSASASPEGSAPDGRVAEPAAEGTGTEPPPTVSPAVATAQEPLVDLVALMRDVGFADARAEDLAQYVPVPPGAVGAAGSFAGPQGEVRVALIRYTNRNYVRPHLTDLEERRRVVPELAEAWASSDNTVVHVKAIDRGTAERVRDAIVTRLGWTR